MKENNAVSINMNDSTRDAKLKARCSDWLFRLLAVTIVAFPLLSACGNEAIHAPTHSQSHSNRLIHESSPYLLDHAHDPVDWYPWGDAAFEAAKKQNKPILLSVGYSACHWCHIMHRESFQDDETARQMNDDFINIKVDREERPDVDDVYMRAVQAMTGRGGWPMTVFLTPDLKPFFGGTYFPKEAINSLPAFRSVLKAVQKSWKDDPTGQSKVSDRIAHYIADSYSIKQSSTPVSDGTIDSGVNAILERSDPEYGGLDADAKFPMSEPISLCLQLSADPSESSVRRRTSMKFIENTLTKMSSGGIHDHIGGGFFRYTTDRSWHTPHFEKMLYDNALISQNYLDAYLVTGRPCFAATARDTLDFALRELRSPEGAFYSSLDADSAGEEGSYYTYSMQELVESLGEKDAHWFGQLFSVSTEGRNILFMLDSPEALAKRSGLPLNEFSRKVQSLTEKLLAARSRRSRPDSDEKVISSWNALMISSLVRGYKVLGDEKYLDAAKQTARFLLSRMYRNQHLYRTWSAGTLKNDGYLDDYAYTAQALLDLGAVDFDPTWLKSALDLNTRVLEHFEEPNGGDFFYTADYQNAPITRTKFSQDSSLPAGTAVQLSNLIRIAEITNDDLYRQKAEPVLKHYNEAMKKNPLNFSSMLKALDLLLHAKTKVVLVATSDSKQARGLLKSTSDIYAPHTDTVLCLPQFDYGAHIAITDKQVTTERPAVYLCHDQLCEKPITDPSLLRARMKQLAANGQL